MCSVQEGFGCLQERSEKIEGQQKSRFQGKINSQKLCQKLILQKGNFKLIATCGQGINIKRKILENPRLRRSKRHQPVKPTSLRADSSLQVKGLVLSILRGKSDVFIPGTRTGLWMVTKLRFEPL